MFGTLANIPREHTEYEARRAATAADGVWDRPLTCRNVARTKDKKLAPARVGDLPFTTPGELPIHREQPIVLRLAQRQQHGVARNRHRPIRNQRPPSAAVIRFAELNFREHDPRDLLVEAKTTGCRCIANSTPSWAASSTSSRIAGISSYPRR